MAYIMRKINHSLMQCLHDLHSWECHEDICNYLHYPTSINAIDSGKYSLAYIMYEAEDNTVYLFNRDDVIDSVEYDGDVDAICRRLDRSFSDHLNKIYAQKLGQKL